MSLPHFTDTQVARMCWLAGKGWSAREIAQDARIHAEAGQVAFMIDRLGLPALRKEGEYTAATVEISTPVRRGLDAAAVARHVSRNQLVEMVITAAVESQMIGALLNDGVS